MSEEFLLLFYFLMRESGVSGTQDGFDFMAGFGYVSEYAETISDCQHDLKTNSHRLKHGWQRDAQQGGIDKQVDSCSIFLALLYAVNDFSSRSIDINDTLYNILSENQTNLLHCNYTLYESTSEYRKLKLSNATFNHYEMVEVYNAINLVDVSGYDSDLIDLEDVEVAPKRKNADEQAKREAYLWDHGIAVRAETTGPGIKTRNKFHIYKTIEK